MTIERLRSNVADAQAKLARLVERGEKARATLRDAEIDLHNLELSASSEQVQAALDEATWDAAGHARKVATASSKIAAAAAVLTATRGAIEAQQAVVEAAEGEVFVRRHELLTKEFPPFKREVFEAMQRLCRAAVALRQIAHKHDFYDGAAVEQLLFADADGTLFPSADMVAKSAQCALLNSAAHLADYLGRNYDPTQLAAVAS